MYAGSEYVMACRAAGDWSERDYEFESLNPSE
jgi:hypothetical protein